MKVTISRGREIKFFFFFSIISFLSFSQSNYYYYNGEQVSLTLNKQFVNIVTTNTFDENQLDTMGVQSFVFKNIGNEKIAKLQFSNNISSQSEYEQKINSLKNLVETEGVFPYFTYNGSTFGTNNKLYVRLNQLSDTIQLNNLVTIKNLLIEGTIPYMPLWYKIKTTSTTQDTTLELAAYFYESGYIASAEPGFTGLFSIPEVPQPSPAIFIGSLDTCYNEPNAELQWNLFNNESGNELADINICGAWEETTGGPQVLVTIIDTGVDDGILDLPVDATDVIDPAGGMDEDFYYTVTQNPEHGTLVSSVIGALHNGQRMGGIAPDCNFFWVATDLANNFDQEAVATGINVAVFGRGSKVINMSFTGGGAPSENLEMAFNNAIAEGVILVAPSGNLGVNTIAMPANYPSILAVGGSTIGGNRQSSSNYGPLLDIVAPAEEIMSIDIGGTVYGLFGKTSAAAPHVAGIAALMFTVKPELKGEAIRNILRRTAQKSGTIPYAIGDLSIGSRNDEMGFGIPNATACVLTAKEFETTSGVLDMHMRNSLKDFGVEPDNVTKHANFVLWNSPDIWIPENTGNEFYEHRNPIYSGPGSTETVLVRVINKSNETVPINSLNVKLYWSKTGGHTNTWPENWDGTTTYNAIPVGGPVGNPNGQVNTFSSIEPGEQGLYFFTWDVPNPDDFVGYMNSDPNEFSFLARIDSNDDPMTNEIMVDGDVWTNTRNNNNIVWKNVVVIEPAPGPAPMTGTISITNFDSVTKSYSLEFGVDWEEIGKLIYDEAEVTLQMDNELYQNWSNNGSLVSNATENSQKFLVTDDEVVFDNISLEPGETRNITLTFNFLVDELTNKKEYYYHFIQRDISTDDIVYGKTFLIKKGESSTFDANAGNDQQIDKNESVTLSAESITAPATYNWYDPQGNLIFTGQDISVSPELTQQYTLEVINNSDGVKDYDNVTVTVNPFVLGVIAPNPAQTQITIDYIAEDATSAYLILTEVSTSNTFNHIIDTQVGQHQIDVSSYATGIYLVTLVCDGTAIETKTIIIE